MYQFLTSLSISHQDKDFDMVGKYKNNIKTVKAGTFLRGGIAIKWPATPYQISHYKACAYSICHIF